MIEHFVARIIMQSHLKNMYRIIYLMVIDIPFNLHCLLDSCLMKNNKYV